MSIKIVDEESRQLHYVPDHFKTKEMCDKAVREDPSSLRYVPDWLVTQGQVKIWHGDDDYSYDDERIEWYEGYKKRKAHKVQIKKELIPIVWHPSRWWDSCMSEDEEKETEKLWK